MITYRQFFLLAGMLLLLVAASACVDRGDPAPQGQATSTSGTTPASCGQPATKVHQVQGAGNRSPMVGRTVTVEGIVVGDFQKNDGDRYHTNLGGYFLQEEDADADDDPRTSEGIYINDSSMDVSLGDLVRVTGTVIEIDSLTQLNRPSEQLLCGADQPLPSPAQIEFPLSALGELEAYEGMLVTFPQELIISEHFNYDRYGEVVLGWSGPDGQRAFQPTQLYPSDDPRAVQAQLDAALSRITLDDGISDQNPSINRHPDGGLFTPEHGFRGGDRIIGLTGVLDQRFGTYRLQPVLGADYLATNDRPDQPKPVGGSVRAGAFNVLNYFVTLSKSGSVCGPNGKMECRGADTAAEFQRQRTKIVAALSVMDAHAVGLMEIENDVDGAAIADLVAGLNEVSGAGAYAYVDAGGFIGSDAITVGLVYQPAVLEPIGPPAVLDAPNFVDPRASGTGRNRAALAQTFQETATGERFTLVVNHFKSKGSACGEPGERGPAGNCNLTRTLAARALIDWLANDPTGSGDPDYLLVGDFNSYAREEPITALLAGPDNRPGTPDDYVDLLQAFEGDYAYTYVFDGLLGYLDYAIASPSLAPQVTGATAWHINADEPDLLDYDMSFKKATQAALYAPDPYRSSDHDPVVVGLELGRR